MLTIWSYDTTGKCRSLSTCSQTFQSIDYKPRQWVPAKTERVSRLRMTKTTTEGLNNTCLGDARFMCWRSVCGTRPADDNKKRHASNEQTRL